VDEVVVSEEKLAGYVLNPQHPVGGHKARLFRDLLSIEASDWRYLAAQLADGLERVQLRRVRAETRGVKYEADIPVVGRNGKTLDVRTAWIVRSAEPIRLTTAYLSVENEQSRAAGCEPDMVPSNLVGDERWAALYSIAMDAGQRAGRSAIPTPMRVVTEREESASAEVVTEGECGSAFVLVKDGKARFAGWLRRNSLGFKEVRSTQRVFANVDTQSVSRAEAFARAFARVLARHGVQCEVGTYLT
jgi:hypothetical protein